MKFHILRSHKNDEFYFNLVARNGKIVATSETYKRKATMRKTIAKINPSFKVVDLTEA